MFTIIICAVIGFLLGLIIWSDKITDFETFIDSFGSGILLGLVGAIIGLGIAIAIPAKTETVKTTYTLEVLQDNGTSSGSFFLGSGQIDGKMQYVYYYQNEGFYKLNQIRCDKAKVKYTEGKPKIEILSTQKVENAFMNYTLSKD